MRREGYWVIRTWEAGSVGEKTKFWVPGKRPDKKLTRKQRDMIKKQAQNEYSSVKRLARILNKYFSEGDYVFGLDYSSLGIGKLEKWAEGKGVDLNTLGEEDRRSVLWAAADHEITNLLRRVHGRAKKAGIEVRAAYVTSDLKWDDEEEKLVPVRVHHHLVINREAKALFEDAWGKLGGCTWSTLYDYQDDRTDLANYMIRQVRKVPDAKKFRTTRNLVPPKPKDRIASNDSEIQVPRGGKLLFRREFTKSGQPQYIRYVLPRYTKQEDRTPDVRIQ